MRHALAIVLVLAASGVARAAEPEPPAGASAELEAVRQQLVALDIEKALAALARFLENPDLTDALRIEALDLRAQAHAGSGNLDAVEKDYKALLGLQAAYAPRAEVTSKKALARFAKVRAAMVGTVKLDCDPKDAALAVDARPTPLSPDGELPVLAGDRRLTLTRTGFDPYETTIHAIAGQATPVQVRMTPNARALVVRTDVAGVEVSLDGAPRGLTAPSEDGTGAEPTFALTLPDVPIGEHDLRFVKTCFAPETVSQIVSVDLADRSPKLLPVVSMRPSRARVQAVGAHYAGDLRVDGEPVASLPLESFALCPGKRAVTVTSSGRVVWAGEIDVEEADVTLDLTPRPNVVLVGAAWPQRWGTVSTTWSLRSRIDLPAGADLTVREGWAGVSIPPATDLAVAVVPGAGISGDDRIVLYSPILHQVEVRAAPPPAASSRWEMPLLGAQLVDGQADVVVVAVAPDSPAAKASLQPGDRILAIGGASVRTASAAREAVAHLEVGAKAVLDVVSPAQATRKIEIVPAAAPALSPSPDDDEVVRAAWASVDAAAGASSSAPALAALATLLARAGQDRAALDAWRRVLESTDGWLAARAAYEVGAGLQAAGQGAEAASAFKRARDGGRRYADDVLSAAAEDRLADLGVGAR